MALHPALLHVHNHSAWCLLCPTLCFLSPNAGKQYAVYAGKEISRALAKDSLDPKDCTDELDDLTKEETQRLEQQVAHISSTYDAIGKVGSTT